MVDSPLKNINTSAKNTEATTSNAAKQTKSALSGMPAVSSPIIPADEDTLQGLAAKAGDTVKLGVKSLLHKGSQLLDKVQEKIKP